MNTDRMIRVLYVIALVVVLATGYVFGQWLVRENAVPAESPVLPDNMILEEDEPGWSCELHGNRQCGPSVGIDV